MRQSVTNERPARLALPDGRTLSYLTFGEGADPSAPLAVVLDGPGSRGLVRAMAPLARSLGIRLVAPDRPGAGGSTLAPQRGIADWPADHAALLDALGADHAGLIAQSGGTPFALAAAAVLRDRTSAVALVGPLAPLVEAEPHRTAGRQLRTAAALARRAPWLLRAGLRAAGRGARKDPERTARRAVRRMPPADAAALGDPRLWALHVQATSEILGRPEGLAHELGLFARPWGIDLGAVSAPVALWSGERDAIHPAAHARWLAARLGDAPVAVVPDAATFGMLAIYPDALRFAAAR